MTVSTYLVLECDVGHCDNTFESDAEGTTGAKREAEAWGWSTDDDGHGNELDVCKYHTLTRRAERNGVTIEENDRKAGK